MTDMISPDVLTLDLVQELFAAAEMEVEIDDDGDLIVTDPEDGWITLVSMDSERQFVHIRSYARFTEDSEPEARLRLVDRLNRETIFVRWYTDEDVVLVADYTLGYEGGLTAFQLLRAYRWFGDVTAAGVAAIDEDDIIQ